MKYLKKKFFFLGFCVSLTYEEVNFIRLPIPIYLHLWDKMAAGVNEHWVQVE